MPNRRDNFLISVSNEETTDCSVLMYRKANKLSRIGDEVQDSPYLDLKLIGKVLFLIKNMSAVERIEVKGL